MAPQSERQSLADSALMVSRGAGQPALGFPVAPFEQCVPRLDRPKTQFTGNLVTGEVPPAAVDDSDGTPSTDAKEADELVAAAGRPLAMIAYLIAGPDGTKAGRPQRAPAPAQEATP